MTRSLDEYALPRQLADSLCFGGGLDHALRVFAHQWYINEIRPIHHDGNRGRVGIESPRMNLWTR